MKKINIHVEGEGEIRFLSILLFKYFGYEFKFIGGDNINMVFENDKIRIDLRPYDIDNKSGGFDSKKLRSLLKYLKETSIPKKENNILILDADTTDHKPAGGIIKRKEYLNKLKKEFGFGFQYFLIPDNSTDGNLEIVLDKLIASKGQPFYNCLKNYTQCLSKLSKENTPIELLKENLQKDSMKATISWYTYNMVGQEKRKETSLSKRDYSIEDIWNLEDESLKPLLEFLNKNLSE